MFRDVPQVIDHPWMSLWAQHLHEKPKKLFSINLENPDEVLLQHIEDNYGFKKGHTRDSLQRNAFNHATATYSLLEEMKDP